MEFLKKAAPRPPEEAEERSRSVAGIIRDIRTRGDAALAEYSARFDGSVRPAGNRALSTVHKKII